MDTNEEEFRRFAAGAMDQLRGLAYLTCGDWAAAEDAVSRSLTKLYARWAKVSSPHRYATRMVVRASIDEKRRPWRRERSASHEFPEVIAPDPADAVNEQIHVRSALRQLPPGQRAVLVLRYYADFSVDEAAEALGRSPGTIKSQAARGIARLRDLLAPHHITIADDDGEENIDDAQLARLA